MSSTTSILHRFAVRGQQAFHQRLRDERGEGVISAAIAVLIMAFLGVAMWVGFNQIWQNAETTTGDQVEQIGN
jgi:hypothetical protein